MKIKYLTYTQAQAICEDHQYLIDQPFDVENEADGLIRQIVVAPYSRILQWNFIRLLLHARIDGQEVASCPNGKYDVIILPDQKGRATLSYRVKTLRSYLLELGTELNSANYNALRII